MPAQWIFTLLLQSASSGAYLRKKFNRNVSEGLLSCTRSPWFSAYYRCSISYALLNMPIEIKFEPRPNHGSTWITYLILTQYNFKPKAFSLSSMQCRQRPVKIFFCWNKLNIAINIWYWNRMFYCSAYCIWLSISKYIWFFQTNLPVDLKIHYT